MGFKVWLGLGPINMKGYGTGIEGTGAASFSTSSEHHRVHWTRRPLACLFAPIGNTR